MTRKLFSMSCVTFSLWLCACDDLATDTVSLRIGENRSQRGAWQLLLHLLPHLYMLLLLLLLVVVLAAVRDRGTATCGTDVAICFLILLSAKISTGRARPDTTVYLSVSSLFDAGKYDRLSWYLLGSLEK